MLISEVSIGAKFHIAASLLMIFREQDRSFAGPEGKLAVINPVCAANRWETSTT